MYRVGVTAEATASHFLIGGDFGPENDLHAHLYRFAVTLSGKALDRHGFLVDIDQLREVLAAHIARFEGAVLNDLPELAGLNPSVEWVARFSAEAIASGIDTRRLVSLTVQVWEAEDAWASFRLDL